MTLADQTFVCNLRPFRAPPIDCETQGVALGFRAAALSELQPCNSGFTSRDGCQFMGGALVSFAFIVQNRTVNLRHGSWKFLKDCGENHDPTENKWNQSFV